MIKKIAIASIAVLALAGCASTKSADPVPVVTVTEQASPPVTDTYASAEDTYLADAHAMDNSYIEATTDSDLLDIGNATCAALNEGNTITDILTYLVEEGTFTNGNQAEAGGILIAAAVFGAFALGGGSIEAFLTQSS